MHGRTRQKVRSLLLAGGRMVKDHGNKRWTVYYSIKAADFGGEIPALPADLRGPSKSRTWAAAGETMTSAYKVCLLWVWRKHYALGFPEPPPDIKEVLQRQAFADYIHSDSEDEAGPESSGETSGSSSSSSTGTPDEAGPSSCEENG